MSKSTYLLKLPTSVKTAAARFEKAEGVSLSQFQRARDQRVPICEPAGGEERSLGPRADESEDGGMPVAEA
jgi:hypothetical protein